MNISLSVLNKSICESIYDGVLEHLFLYNRNDTNLLTASTISNILIILTNGYLLYFTLRRPKKTFLDWMMVCDCILCICNVFTLVHMSHKLFHCYFIPFFSYFINICNRLLALGIVFYRYTYVIKNNLVRTKTQQKALESIIFGFIMITSLAMTGFSVYYKDASRTFLCNNNYFYLCKIYKYFFSFLDCTEELHNFYYDSEDFYEEVIHGSPRWNLPLNNSFHALTLICFSASILITPVGYGAIYRFRRNQDNKVSGLSTTARNQRKNRNLVTMKFNMFNWILETLSSFLVLILPSYRYFTILYILVNSCGTPLVYFMGIEENRSMAKEYFKLNLRKNKTEKVTKSVDQTETNNMSEQEIA